MNWKNSSLNRNCYVPVRLSDNSFFQSVVCEEELPHRERAYDSLELEYSIIHGDTLRFSFKDGSIALAYRRQMLDKETGYPLIPDHYSYVTAITKYVTMKMMEREFYSNREGAQAKMLKAEADWQWYCGQAGNHALMPKGVDEWQNLVDQSIGLLPNHRRYFSFFGKTSRNSYKLRGYNG